MCQTLHDLDIQSRAAASIVDDWQGPIAGDSQTSGELTAQSGAALVRSVWTINELVALLLHAVDASHGVPEICAEINKRQAVDDGHTEKVVATIRGFVVSMRRLDRAIRAAINIVDMLQGQGLSIARADELLECPVVLSEIIDEVVRFSEDLEWESLSKQALPLSEFKELAAYLVEAGKASA